MAAQAQPATLKSSYALDRLWRSTMGLPVGDSKEQPLQLVVAVLTAAGTPYALIGGVAIQLHSQEPRTTLDIDMAVATFAEVPVAALQAAGFDYEGRHLHSDNWRAPGAGTRAERVAVQFSAQDVGIADAVRRAQTLMVDGLPIRVADPADLVVLKLAAAEEPTRRLRKRRQDVVDVLLLVEEFPDAGRYVSDLAVRLRRLRDEVMAL